MATIALINVYLGRLPAWIDNYIETCKANPSIVWYLFGDDVAPQNTATNVHYNRITRHELEARIRQRLGVNGQMARGYKVCDFKPTYGELFSDYLQGCDCWGHCDLDIVWGNVRKFVTPELLHAFDVISSWDKRLSGPLTIYRNDMRINSLFRRADYKKILEDPVNQVFDERGFSQIVKQAHDRKELRLQCLALHEYDGFHPGVGFGPSACLWEQGKLTCSVEKREILFYHFARSKKWSWPDIWRK